MFVVPPSGGLWLGQRKARLKAVLQTVKAMSRILVIEDDPAILRGLADNLKFDSHEVLTAADGEAGYRLIKEQQPDLIILDLMMPKLSGYEVCRKVRDEGLATPILMLTARGQEADRVLRLDLGAD